MLPQDDDNFYMPAFGVWIAFQRDATGKISGFTARRWRLRASRGGNEFEAGDGICCG